MNTNTPQKQAPSITESDLYAMGMESPTAWQKMPELCAALGFQFPPKYEQRKPACGAENLIESTI